MASPKRNRAVIIVNHQFLQAKGLRPRVGARREVDKLFKALSKCNYDVKLFLDLTAKEIEEVYEEGMFGLKATKMRKKVRLKVFHGSVGKLVGASKILFYCSSERSERQGREGWRGLRLNGQWDYIVRLYIIPLIMIRYKNI